MHREPPLACLQAERSLRRPGDHKRYPASKSLAECNYSTRVCDEKFTSTDIHLHHGYPRPLDRRYARIHRQVFRIDSVATSTGCSSTLDSIAGWMGVRRGVDWHVSRFSLPNIPPLPLLQHMQQATGDATVPAVLSLRCGLA